MTAPIPCARTDCEWTSAGTLNGAGPSACPEPGGLPGCLKDFMSIDPEDWDWATYLAKVVKPGGCWCVSGLCDPKCDDPTCAYLYGGTE